MGSYKSKNQKVDLSSLPVVDPEPDYEIKTRQPMPSTWALNIKRGQREDELRGFAYAYSRRKCHKSVNQLLQCEKNYGSFWAAFDCQYENHLMQQCLAHEFEVEMDKLRRNIKMNHEWWWRDLQIFLQQDMMKMVKQGNKLNGQMNIGQQQNQEINLEGYNNLFLIDHMSFFYYANRLYLQTTMNVMIIDNPIVAIESIIVLQLNVYAIEAFIMNLSFADSNQFQQFVMKYYSNCYKKLFHYKYRLLQRLQIQRWR